MKKILFIILMTCLYLGARSQGAHYAKPLTTAVGANIESASTLVLGYDGNYFTVTGTTTIDSIAMAYDIDRNQPVTLRFADALTLTHSADLLLNNDGNNITTVAGDVAQFERYASGQWVCVNYTRADGSALKFGAAGNNNNIQLNDNGQFNATDNFRFIPNTLVIDNNVINDFSSIGSIEFQSNDDASSAQTFSRITGSAGSTNTGLHSGQLNFFTAQSGSLTNILTIGNGVSSFTGNLSVDNGFFSSDIITTDSIYNEDYISINADSVVLNNKKIVDVADPENPQDVVTLAYFEANSARTRTVVYDNSEIQSLNTTPQDIIPNSEVASNQFVSIQSIYAALEGSANYNETDQIIATYNSGFSGSTNRVPLALTSSLPDYTIDYLDYRLISTPVAGSGIRITTLNGDVTGGDAGNTLTVTIVYRIVTIN